MQSSPTGAGTDGHGAADSGESWPRPLAEAVALVAASRLPMLTAWGPDLRAIPNEAFRTLLGPCAGPSTLREVWPGAWDEIQPLVEAALAGEGCLSEDIPLARPGSTGTAWFTMSLSPLRDMDGYVRGVLWTCVETTDKVEAARVARFRVVLDERLRDVSTPAEATAAGAEALGRHLAAARCGYAEVGPDGWTLATESDWTRDDLVASLAGDVSLVAGFGPVETDLRAGRPSRVEDCRAPDGGGRFAGREARYRARLAVPVVRDLRLRAVLTVHADDPRLWGDAETSVAVDTANRLWETVERLRADAALRDGEERLRLALEAGRMGAWDIDLARGKRVISERSAQIHGVPAERLTDRDDWLTHVHPDDRDAARHAFDSLLSGMAPYDVEYRVQGDDGATRWVSSRAIAQAGPDGTARRVIGVHADVTARKDEERRRRVMIDELNHRVKNTLATVQSIASQTLRSDRPVAELKTAFEGRLMALSRTHDILTRENWDGASLHEVVARVVEAHAGTATGRVRVDGPDVRLVPRTALAMASCLQELASNAVRHGSLSTMSGLVDLDWSVQPGPNGKRILMRWVESGGPPVSEPKRRGLGTKLIERGLAHEMAARVELRFPPGGLRFSVDGTLPTS